MTEEPWSRMPWLLQLLTGRTSPQKTAADRCHQQDDVEADDCNYTTNTAASILYI